MNVRSPPPLYGNADVAHIHVFRYQSRVPGVRPYTTVLNALLMPVVGDYLAAWRTSCAAMALWPSYIWFNQMAVWRRRRRRQSTGAIIIIWSQRRQGGGILAEVLGDKNLVAVDMGGTTRRFLVQDGRIRLINLSEVDGCPVRSDGRNAYHWCWRWFSGDNR